MTAARRFAGDYRAISANRGPASGRGGLNSAVKGTSGDSGATRRQEDRWGTATGPSRSQRAGRRGATIAGTIPATEAGSAARTARHPSLPRRSTRSGEVWADLCAVLYRVGDGVAAVSGERAVQVAPALPRARSNLVAALVRLGRLEEALAQASTQSLDC